MGDGVFKNQSTQFLGISFSSKLEAAVYQILKFREAAREIEIIQVQAHCLICGVPGHDCDHKLKIEYIADFKVRDVKTGEIILIEAKGFANERWPMKLRLYRHYGPHKLEIWMGNHRKPFLKEIVIPQWMA